MGTMGSFAADEINIEKQNDEAWGRPPPPT
jgi:hypothetical protein